jgi:hypothetical protein
MIGQAMRVVLRYLQEHPAELHRRAHVLIVEALWGAFPCPPALPPPHR